MSEIKVDTLTGKTTAKTVTVTVGATATMSLEQGLTKAYGVFDMSNNSIPDSFNLASFTDRGTGCLYGNYTNSMGSASHTVTGSSSPIQEGTMATNNSNRYVIASSDTASRYSENSRNVSTNAQQDDPYIAAVSHGDLA